MWTDKSELITNFNSNVPSAKTSSLPALAAHIRYCLQHLVEVMDFYNKRRFKKLKWNTYICSQKCYDKIVKYLKGTSLKPLIVWGDASFLPSGKKNPAVPTKTLKKKLATRMDFVEHNKF